MGVILQIENISKQYRLGTVGTGSLAHDLNRWWHTVRGKEDPYLKIGEVNDRGSKATSDYVWALKDINFEVQAGEVLGIIGKNGAGKSTLLKLLSRVTAPTTGAIRTRGRIASLLEVGTGFHGELTGRENIYMNGAILGMTKKEIDSKLDEIIAFSDCERYIDTPVKRYSSGMTVRLGFAVAAHLEPDILVVDEVLAVGDAEFQKKAIGKMQDISGSEGRTVLFVSHNMAAVKSLCTRAIVLENGRKSFEGNVDSAISNYLKIYNVSNKVSFSNKPLKNICINQDKNNIVIAAEYEVYQDLDLPNLGFIIYNEFGHPVLGGNPVILKSSILKNKSFKRGKIKAVIENPRLKDGAYSASIWFGNSKKNFQEERDCLYFEIKNMVELKYAYTSFTGSQIPSVKWDFL
ncbi:MAG: ABC transporter ATP-binding protein [Flavobacteriaceae bacterium]|nr:ABC transporter ATP-binding protein [Flavobacteriaceae bacterium]